MGHQYPLVHRAVCLRLSVKGLLTAGTGAQPFLLLPGVVSRQDFILRHKDLNVTFSTFFFFFSFASVPSLAPKLLVWHQSYHLLLVDV